MLPTVSIIVPIYNGDSFLNNCIESVLCQTFSNWELLLIDDGSEDHSASICEEYAAKDERIKVFHKENGGVSSARCYGVNHARGEWITFLDADDELLLDALYDLVDNASDRYDLVVGFGEPPVAQLDEYDICTYRHRLLCGLMPVSPWAKLYRRNVLTSWCFDIPREIKLGEDMLMNIRFSFCANNRVKVLPDNKIVYFYRFNMFQTTQRFCLSFEEEDLFVEYLERSIPESLKGLYRDSL